MIPDFTDTALSRLWSLEGRVAVVTGAGSGMGQATSLRLAEAGAATVVADIAADKAQETADLIGKRTPGAQAVPLAVDVTDPASVRALGDAVTERFGRHRHLGEHGLAELERRHRRLPGRDVAAGTRGQPGRFLLHRPRGGPPDAAAAGAASSSWSPRAARTTAGPGATSTSRPSTAPSAS